MRCPVRSRRAARAYRARGCKLQLQNRYCLVSNCRKRWERGLQIQAQADDLGARMSWDMRYASAAAQYDGSMQGMPLSALSLALAG